MSPYRHARSSHHRKALAATRGTSLAALVVAAAAISGATPAPIPRADAAPAGEVTYLHAVTVRRHYDFPNSDAVGYGYRICGKVSAGENFAQVMGDVKSEVVPGDEFAANYLVSYAVSLLCPEQIWQLRNSAAGYRPPAGTEGPTSGLQGGQAGRE